LLRVKDGLIFAFTRKNEARHGSGKLKNSVLIIYNVISHGIEMGISPVFHKVSELTVVFRPFSESFVLALFAARPLLKISEKYLSRGKWKTFPVQATYTLRRLDAVFITSLFTSRM